MNTGTEKEAREKEKRNWRQACERPGCGKDKFYRLIREKKIRAFRVGERGVWVYAADIEQIIDNNY